MTVSIRVTHEREWARGGKELLFMFTSVLQVLVLLLASATANTGTSQASSELKTPNDVGAFMQTYYSHPQPELIGQLIDALRLTGFLQKLNNASSVIGFFSEIFAAHADRVSEWRALISNQDDQISPALAQAVSVSKAGGVLKLEGHSAGLNDEYWGAFFASGNPAFVQRLVDQLRYLDERNDEALFFAGATASWSLASNAQTQPAVRFAIEDARSKADKRTQELIAELLAADPASIKQGISEIIKQQREVGKWR